MELALFRRVVHYFWHKGLPVLFLGGSLFLVFSLWSYAPNDPSFNRASDNNVLNWMGYSGAFLADPLWQLLGLSAILLAALPLMWSVQTLIEKKFRLAWLKIPMLAVAVVASMMSFAILHTPETWYFPIGGVIGEMLRTRLLLEIPFWGYALGMPVIAVSAVLVAMGFSFKRWMGLGGWIAALWLYAYDWCKDFKMHKGSFEEVFPEEEEEEVAVHYNQPSKKSASASMVAKVVKPAASPKRKEARQEVNAEGVLPPIELLHAAEQKSSSRQHDKAVLEEKARRLEDILKDFGVQGSVTRVHPGPVVVLYELEPAAGTKSSRVIGLADDIARSMSATAARIAVIPGRNALGIELPNEERETVYLRKIIESQEYHDAGLKLPIALGKDIAGRPISVDLSRMPHLLVAGTTGSGKSVAINTMILSLVYRLSPDQCKFIMIDPKMLELSVYDGIPHLLAPVVTEPRKAVVALKWVVKEMENRYRLMSNLGVRNIAGYNERISQAAAQGEELTRSVQTGFDMETGKPIIETVPMDMEPLPYIVVIVDEMADLMLVAGKDIEASIQRLAQMARAAGIHLIMATQRPSVDVITGVVKANFPTRISFQVTSRIDSRTILGEQGAEQLLGMGDMLYMSGGSRIMRVHGPFVDDREVESVVAHLKMQQEPSYVESITEEEEDGAAGFESNSGDELYDKAVNIVLRDRKASTSYIQRCLKIGYNRAATIIEKMEQEGVVSPANHVGKREVLVGSESE